MSEPNKRLYALGLIMAITGLVPVSSHAEEPLNYKVFKDGEPIGFETVTFTESPDGLAVDVTTQTDVRVLFLTFQYHHKRREIWRDGNLVSVSTETSDDGTPYAFLAEYDGDCYELAGQNTPRREACNGAWPLTLWSEQVTTKDHLYSVIDATPHTVRIDKTENGTLTLGDETYPARHYIMSGDVSRDLWYGEDGKLLKTSFKRKGYDIDFIRVDLP
ncbi:DUF6134 family protein [Thalassospira sp.]|uniref:DUF6134 family protein n=1 Tax=Thalassospira sp. TaxID=1912094 RepID=UPI0027370E10|nr:DUF6134 family protein [Thalassospira sp.]MDP2699108.1 DUF6134 family protein [Thalassospira sp.]